MDKSSIDQREKSMVNFMDEVNKHKKSQQAANNYANSVDVKRRVLDKKKSDAKGVCLDLIFSKIYKDALPMDDEYKIAHGNDLDAEFHDFISDKAPDGLEYYVRESIKKGNKAAKSIMEAVDKVVRDAFFEVSMNIEETNPEDVEFDPDSEENQEKIRDITDAMGTDDISEVIKNNVKQAALSDIERTKAHDEEMKNIVDELKNDPKITTEAALDRALRLRGIGTPKFYQPTLFSGIMINKSTLIKESVDDIPTDLVSKKAFTESVKEMTKLNVLHALNFEPITPASSKKLAKDYAQMKVPTSKVSLYSESVDQLYEEGANLEIRKIFKDNFKNINDDLKAIKKNLKTKDYKEATKNIDRAKKNLKKVQDEIRKVDSTTGSLVFAWLLSGDLMFLGRRLIASLNPFVSYIVGIDILIKRIIVLTEECKKKDYLELDDLNLYKNGILVRLKEYEKAFNKFEKIIEKKEKEESEKSVK